MLLKQFHYLSDGRAPLVEDLGPILCTEKQGFWRVLSIFLHPIYDFILEK